MEAYKMKRGCLIIYDDNGKVWYESGDADDGGSGGLPPHAYPVGLPYIETQFGELNGKRLISVDVETKTLVTEDVVVPISSEQLKIQELENQMLLMVDNEVGGIL
jgi:hypothetical protein